MYTDEQIQERAKEIGARNYHPIPPNFYHSEQHLIYPTPGITIRGELMRTAMGVIIPLEYSQRSGDLMCAKSASMFVNALLTQMAKDELGVTE